MISLFMPYIMQAIVLSALLALPYKKFLQSNPGKLIAALAVAFLIGAGSYFPLNQLENTFIYLPSGEYAKKFEEELVRCGLDSQAVQLRYVFGNGAVANAYLNTITIDPVFWKGIEQDPNAINAKQWLDLYYLPHLNPVLKEYLSNIAPFVTPATQAVFFRQACGYIAHHVVAQRIVIGGAGAGIATYAGLAAASMVIGVYGGYAAWAVGALIGCCVNGLLKIVDNVLLKTYQERQVDVFAAQLSDAQELEEAAIFIEKSVLYSERGRKKEWGVLACLPNTILYGGPNPVVRAAFWREQAQAKKSVA